MANRKLRGEMPGAPNGGAGTGGAGKGPGGGLSYLPKKKKKKK